MSRLEFAFPTAFRSFEDARPALERELDGLFPAGLLESRWETEALHLKGPGAAAIVTWEDGRLVGRGELKPPALFMREMIEEKVVGALRRAAGDPDV